MQERQESPALEKLRMLRDSGALTQSEYDEIYRRWTAVHADGQKSPRTFSPALPAKTAARCRNVTGLINLFAALALGLSGISALAGLAVCIGMICWSGFLSGLVILLYVWGTVLPLAAGNAAALHFSGQARDALCGALPDLDGYRRNVRNACLTALAGLLGTGATPAIYAALMLD